MSFYRGSTRCPYCDLELQALEAVRPEIEGLGAKLGRDLAADPGQYLAELYLQLGNDLPKVNGDDSWTLPMPGRFVIGQDGVVGYAEVNPDYTRRPEPEELLPVLRAMAVSRAA